MIPIFLFFDYFWDETLPITLFDGDPIKFHLPLIVGGVAFQHLRCVYVYVYLDGLLYTSCFIMSI